MSTEWMDRAACKGATDVMYPSRGEHDSLAHALEVCAKCPVRLKCLALALVTFEDTGIWGGTTARGRQRLRKRLGIRRPPRPSTPTGELAPCGTDAAYRRHLRHGEPPCGPCRLANSAACARSKMRVGWRDVNERKRERDRARRSVA